MHGFPPPSIPSIRPRKYRLPDTWRHDFPWEAFSMRTKRQPEFNFSSACEEWCWDEKSPYGDHIHKGLFLLVRLKGIEPLTKSLEGSCSIHLSYRREILFLK